MNEWLLHRPFGDQTLISGSRCCGPPAPTEWRFSSNGQKRGDRLPVYSPPISCLSTSLPANYFNPLFGGIADFFVTPINPLTLGVSCWIKNNPKFNLLLICAADFFSIKPLVIRTCHCHEQRCSTPLLCLSLSPSCQLQMEPWEPSGPGRGENRAAGRVISEADCLNTPFNSGEQLFCCNPLLSQSPTRCARNKATSFHQIKDIFKLLWGF